MSRETKIEGLIPSIYKRSHLHSAIFWWVSAQKSAFPNSISIENSILSFYKFSDINEDDLPIKTAKQVYLRMNKELIEKQRSDVKN